MVERLHAVLKAEIVGYGRDLDHATFDMFDSTASIL